MELKRKLLNAQLAFDLMGDPEGMNKDALGEHASRRREQPKSCPLHNRGDFSIEKSTSTSSDLTRHSLFTFETSKYESEKEKNHAEDRKNFTQYDE